MSHFYPFRGKNTRLPFAELATFVDSVFGKAAAQQHMERCREAWPALAWRLERTRPIDRFERPAPASVWLIICRNPQTREKAALRRDSRQPLPKRPQGLNIEPTAAVAHPRPFRSPVAPSLYRPQLLDLPTLPTTRTPITKV